MTSHRRDEEGAILVLALIITTVVAVVTGTLLTLTGGGFLATISLRQVAGASTAAASAAQVAVNDLVNGSAAPSSDVSFAQGFTTPWVFDNNIDQTGCFGSSGDLNRDPTHVTPRANLVLPNIAPATGSQTAATSARVECAAVPGTGILGSGVGVSVGSGSGDGSGTGGGGSGGINTTARALTLLGTGPISNGDGLLAKPQGNGNQNTLRIGGSSAINGSIEVDNGTLFSSGTLWAQNGCNYVSQGLIVAPLGLDCAHAAVPDPGYSPNTDLPTVGLTYQPMPAGCEFAPGYYNDAAALTAKVNTGCRGQTVTFDPGTYYFDFQNKAAGTAFSSAAVSSSGSEDMWTIDNTITGGQPTGSSTVPGRCKSPITSKSAQGVQFVFGGDSRIFLGPSANVELCGTYSATSTPPALFGLNSGGSAVLQAPGGTSPTTVTPTGFTTATGTPVTALSAPNDGSSLTWSGAARSSASIVMSGMVASPIPAGSMLKSAVLTLRHTESPTSGAKSAQVTPSLKVKIGSAAATATANQPTGQASLANETIDVTSDLAAAVDSGTLGDPQFTFTETAGSAAATASVDYAQLTLTYYPPTLRAQTDGGLGSTNCVAAGTSCPLISSGTNWGGTFVVDGVTYLPTGYLSIDPGNGSGALVSFKYGLIARGMAMKGQPQYQFGSPIVEIPENGPGFGNNATVVDLKVYLCVAASTCSSGGTLALTVRVMLTDNIDPTTQTVTFTPGQRRVNILSWSEQR